MIRYTFIDSIVLSLFLTTKERLLILFIGLWCEQVEAVSEAFENFQVRTYGIKAQVHETPEKKKRRVM